jgi:hypothetical protein
MNLHRLLQQSLWLGLILLILAACRSASDETPELLIATTKIQVPCTDPLEIQLDETAEEGQPYLSSKPACGVLSDGEKPGTTLTITGEGFASNTEIKFRWKDPLGNEFRHRAGDDYLIAITDQDGAFQIDIIMPYRLIPPSKAEKVLVMELSAQQGEIEEQPTPLHTALIHEHILISSIGSLFGIVVGGALGYVFAIVLRNLFTVKPRSRKRALLLPWRTVLMSLMFPLGFPITIIVQVGFGVLAGIISVGLIVFLLSLTICTSLLIEHWRPTTVANNIIAWMRTLATASVVITFFPGFFANGGLAPVIIVETRLLNYDAVLRYYAILIAIILAFDLLIGILQYVVFRRQEKKLNS